MSCCLLYQYIYHVLTRFRDLIGISTRLETMQELRHMKSMLILTTMTWILQDYARLIFIFVVEFRAGHPFILIL
jgi:hypothetical protein